MKALITGAGGFPGKFLAEALVAAGHSARALIPRTSRSDDLDALGVEVLRGDLRDAAFLRGSVLNGIEVVIHAAILPQKDCREGASIGAETRGLLAAAEEAAVRRFVLISSLDVYAIREKPARAAPALIVENAPLEEDPRFLTEAVRGCIESESAAAEGARRGKMQVLILRPGILYGPGGDWRLPRMGFSLGQSACAVLGRGRDPLPVCYVENCARAVLRAAENASVTGGTFNIVDDELFTPTEFLERLREEARPNLRILRVPYAPVHGLAEAGEAICDRMRAVHLPPASWQVRAAAVEFCRSRARYSNEAAKRTLGWRPEIGKEEALARTMKWFAETESVSRRADLVALRGESAPVAAGAFDRTLSVCVIGCGRIAAEHLAILGDLDSVKTLAVCDIAPEAARRFAREFMILRAYADAEEMLRKEKPQAVHILTPPDSHAALTELAVRYGCHVFVETPMARSAAEAARMIAAAKAGGVSLCAGHSLLYEPVVVQARRILEQGELGDVVWVESYYGVEPGRDPAGRRFAGGDREHWALQLPGGICQELAPHPLSLALDALGEKSVRVRPYGPQWSDAAPPNAHPQELRVLLETPRAGGLASVCLTASPRFLYLNIFGTKRTLFVDLLNKCLVEQRAGRGRPGAPSPFSRTAMNFRRGGAILRGAFAGALRILQRTWSDYDGMELLIRDFYASIQEKRPPPVTGEEGLRVMEVMDEIWPPESGDEAAGGKPNGQAAG